MKPYTPSQEQLEWAQRRHQKIGRERQRQLLVEQHGKCALSGATMLFDLGSRTPSLGHGCHPLSPAIDHIDPGNPHSGVQIVCYALNDMKGHLPADCVKALTKTVTWQKLMKAWREQAQGDPSDREAFARLIRPNAE